MNIEESFTKTLKQTIKTNDTLKNNRKKNKKKQKKQCFVYFKAYLQKYRILQ